MINLTETKKFLEIKNMSTLLRYCIRNLPENKRNDYRKILKKYFRNEDEIAKKIISNINLNEKGLHDFYLHNSIKFGFLLFSDRIEKILWLRSTLKIFLLLLRIFRKAKFLGFEMNLNIESVKRILSRIDQTDVSLKEIKKSFDTIGVENLPSYKKVMQFYNLLMVQEKIKENVFDEIGNNYHWLLLLYVTLFTLIGIWNSTFVFLLFFLLLILIPIEFYYKKRKLEL
jgi:hypothetical protein